MLKKVTLKLIGIILFIVILTSVDIRKIFSVFSGMNWHYFALGIFFLFPSLVLKAYRWNRIKAMQGIQYSLKDSFIMYCVGIYVGTLTPGRLGEFIKVAYLRKDGHPTGKAVFNTVFDRILDLAFLLIFGYFGLLVFVSFLKKQVVVISIVLVVILLLFLLVLAKKNYFKTLFIKFASLMLPKKHFLSFKSHAKAVISQFHFIRAREYISLSFYTFVSWFFYYLMLFFVAKGMGLDISFVLVSVVVTIAGLVTIIPVSISGIGTRDAAMLLLLVPLGFSKEGILAFSFIILVFSLLATAIGFVCWLLKPIEWKREDTPIKQGSRLRRYAPTLALVLLIVLAFFLRTVNTSDLSGGDDSQWAELATYAIRDPKLIVYPHFPEEPIQWGDTYYSRPFAVIPYVVSIFLFGHTKFAIVFPAALFSALSLIFLYLLLKRFFDRLIAFLACFLFTVSPFHLAFSRIGLLDASLIFYCLLALWLLVEGFENGKKVLIYLSALVWFVNMTTTDIRGVVPVLAVLPCVYFCLMKGGWDVRKLFRNVLFRHFMISHVSIFVVFFIFLLIPLTWGEWGWLNNFVAMFFHSVGARESTEYLSFFGAVKSMGKLLIFTPFLGLIFVPLIAGLITSIKKIRKFQYSFWIFYLIGIVFFYTQGQYAPQRQVIFVPAMVAFAALGIIVPYHYFLAQKSKHLLPIVLALSFSYLFCMFAAFSRLFPGEFSATYSSFVMLGWGGLVDVLVEFWWAFVLFILLFFLAAYLRSRAKVHFGRMKSVYLVLIAFFLFLNLAVSFFLVVGGVGIYKRTDATGLVGSYLKVDLADEHYSCVAGVEAKSFSFYTQRPCAFWVDVNTTWLNEQVKKGNLKYFVLNTHHEYKTPGFGNVFPDGTLGPEIGKSSPWLQNHYDKYDWLHANAEDITHEVGLKDGKEFRVYRLKEGVQT